MVLLWCRWCSTWRHRLIKPSIKTCGKQTKKFDHFPFPLGPRCFYFIFQCAVLNVLSSARSRLEQCRGPCFYPVSRIWKEIAWLLGISLLEVIHVVCCCILLTTHSACQLAQNVCSKRRLPLVIITNIPVIRVAGGLGGEYREVPWDEKCNSQRKK
jgi:hypothetical protein